MTLIGLIVTLAIFGLILYLVTTFIPMPQPVKTIIIAIAVLVLILILLQVTGLVGPLNEPIRIR